MKLEKKIELLKAYFLHNYYKKILPLKMARLEIYKFCGRRIGKKLANDIIKQMHFLIKHGRVYVCNENFTSMENFKKHAFHKCRKINS